ncbi:MAG: host attachment protein [Legionellaceae bacterium]|nr:host attachment protein [Legionellaceae bacterium]
MKWIMVANSNDCRIYEYDKNIKKLTLINEISHPENKLKNRDLITDRPGHYSLNATTRGSYEPEMNTHDTAVNKFAKEMALYLNAGRNKHAYDQLILLMPPVMEGLLIKHLKKQIFSYIEQIVQKNLVNLSEHELKLYVAKLLRRGATIH